MFATQSWVQKYPATARAFQRGIDEAQQYADTHPAAVRQILPSYITITAAEAAQVALPYYPDTLIDTELQRVADLMLAGGLLKHPFEMSSILFG
jgi:NitT/TauT family transport system substrate-binding protein